MLSNCEDEASLGVTARHDLLRLKMTLEMKKVDNDSVVGLVNDEATFGLVARYHLLEVEDEDDGRLEDDGV
ncbi:unnamed protein product [Dovyalis caffra]|uniref:Uncharacterized protein n=1 Tax=Dovyalis caffra TaxID=77055 RepID=A0AAV1SRD8_9ROSI|nr:unnamed protein product [Dovyalis caffra]